VLINNNNNKIIMSMPRGWGDRIKSNLCLIFEQSPDLILPLYGCVESKIAPKSIACWP